MLFLTEILNIYRIWFVTVGETYFDRKRTWSNWGRTATWYSIGSCSGTRRPQPPTSTSDHLPGTYSLTYIAFTQIKHKAIQQRIDIRRRSLPLPKDKPKWVYRSHCYDTEWMCAWNFEGFVLIVMCKFIVTGDFFLYVSLCTKLQSSPVHRPVLLYEYKGTKK